MKNKIGYIVSNSGTITLVVNGKPYTVSQDHKNYAKILDALRKQTFDVIDTLIDTGKAITKFFDNKLHVLHGQIMYNEKVIDNSLTKRIFKCIDMDLPYQPLLKFLDNLLQNSSQRAIDEAYVFSEKNELPISEDGMLLGFKRIRDDWMDFYTGTISNTIGTVVKMDRKLVVDDKNQGCQVGLHVASQKYLKEYHAREGRLVCVAVNPKDIVSVPVEMDGTKMRVCEYTVLYEIAPDEIDVHDDTKEYFKAPVYKSDGKTAYHSVRDKNGRFKSATPKRDKNGRFQKSK